MASSSWQRRASAGSGLATTVAVGSRRTTSPARFGPDSRAKASRQRPPAALSMTCDIRRPPGRSSPFAAQSSGAAAPAAANSASSGPTACVGTASRRSSAPAAAAVRSASGTSASGRRTPGRYRRFSRAARIAEARFRSRHQSRTESPFSASSHASVVPQLPAPTTTIGPATGGYSSRPRA